MPSSSIRENNSYKFAKISLNTSRHNRSIRWLCTLLPTRAEPLPCPRVLSIYLTTSTLSDPWSHRTLDGNHHSCTAFIKSEYTVATVLFVLQDRKPRRQVIRSTQRWTTKRHLTSTRLTFLTHSHAFLSMSSNWQSCISVYKARTESLFTFIRLSTVLELTYKSSAMQGPLNLTFKSISSCCLLMWNAGLPGVLLQTTLTLPSFSWRIERALLTKLNNSSGTRVLMCNYVILKFFKLFQQVTVISYTNTSSNLSQSGGNFMP